MRKVLFYEPYALARPHFMTALELMQRHLSGGDQVTHYYCSGALHTCEANKSHDFFTCVDCISRKSNGIDLLERTKNQLQTRDFLELSHGQRTFIANWNKDFHSIDEVKAFFFEGIDVGMAVASSLISRLRNPNPDVFLQKELLSKYFKASFSVYFSFKNHFSRESPDLVYIFNGRFSNIRPVIRLCERLSIPYHVHERGATYKKYGLYTNHLPHSPNAIQAKMFDHWKSDPNKERKIQVATRYFSERRKGKEAAGKAIFRSSKTTSGLPDFWDKSKRNVVIFTSSDDEFAAVGREFFNPLFGNQLRVLTLIKSAVKDDVFLAITLRMHPNLAGTDSVVLQDTLALAGGNFYVIPPESTINTYDLMDASDAVLTFGSTTGVEAAFVRKPSILVGNSMYRNFHITYNPDNPEELIEHIYTAKQPKNMFGTYVYGYYRATFGIPYRYYEPDGFTEGKFKGVRVTSDSWFKRFLFFKPFRAVFKRTHYVKPVL